MAPLTLCVLLWPVAGQEELLIAHEDRVLAHLADHGARVVSRVRALTGEPLEVQILEFPSEDALAGFMNDPRRAALADERDRAVARTQVIRVSTVAHADSG